MLITCCYYYYLVDISEKKEKYIHAKYVAKEFLPPKVAVSDTQLGQVSLLLIH